MQYVLSGYYILKQDFKMQAVFTMRLLTKTEDSCIHFANIKNYVQICILRPGRTTEYTESEKLCLFL